MTDGSASLPRPGDTIAGKYVLDRLLGQGGMGAVFAARHIKLSKPVAIKIMLADVASPEASQRFVNEGRAAANIQSEHVVRVDDVDEENGYAYMVLELLDGEDLAQVLERTPHHRLAPSVAVGYVLQALRGVARAHALGIVHRDLKPSNLFLARRPDGSSVIKVLDFGISKAQGSSALGASPSSLTSTKAMLGSPLYMSPEQLRSSKSVDPRADVWAVGVILYELMTGSLPFMGESLGELFAAILENDPPPLRARAPDVPPALEQIVLRCLQRRPEHRPQSAEEVSAALEPFASGQPVSSPALPVSSPAMPASTAMLGWPGAPGQPHVTAPGQVPVPVPGPPAGAITGPQPSGPVPAIGSWTPQGLVNTGQGWQRTGGTVASPRPSRAPVVIGVAVAGLLALGGAALVLHRTIPPSPPASPPSAATAALPPATPTAPTASSVPTEPVASSKPAEPAEAPATPASASASASAPPAATPKPRERPSTPKPRKGDDLIQNNR